MARYEYASTSDCFSSASSPNPIIAPCRCGLAPKLRRVRPGKWHLVCSGTCDGVWAEGSVLATVANDWAAQQVGEDRRVSP